MPSGRRARWIDITRPLDHETFVFPGDPPVSIETALDPRRGDPARVTRLGLGSHAGTHIDAPCHLPGLAGGVESLPLDALVGPAQVVRLKRRFGPREVAALPRPLPARLLLAGAPVLSAATATALVQRGVRLVGTDGHSIDDLEDDTMPAHRVLLAAGVVVLECLDLSLAPAGRCELIALPLRIPGADGAPARALLRVRAGAAPGASSPSRASRRRSPRASTRRRGPAGIPRSR